METIDFEIRGELITLDALLKATGLAGSGGAAKVLIATGKVQVDGREIRRAGPSYTVDTLRELHQLYPGADFFLLMGQDQAQRLDSWSRAEALPQLATLCVVGRADPLDATQTPAAALMGHALLAVPMPPVPCSSTAVRETLAAGHDSGAMLAPAVARYIAQHLLYAPTFSTEYPD